jgi:hypothetical protein
MSLMFCSFLHVMPIYSVRKKCHSQRKLTRKVSLPRARFNGRLELPGWPGKNGAVQTGPGVAFIEEGG